VLKEFKEFIARGNVLDLAVGVIIGAAFGKIVDSFVKDLLNPIIGIFGNANFENWFLVLKQGTVPGPYATLEFAQTSGAVTLNYGAFLTAAINFVIIAFALFLVVKAANTMRRKQEAAPEAVVTPQDVQLLSEIRDLLAAQK
jgi:large conductance mechanosensitive channel